MSPNNDLPDDIEHIAPRKGWLAVLLSLSAVGLGQFYNGQWHRGLWFVLAMLFLGGPVIVLVALGLPSGLMVPALAVLWVLWLGTWLASHWFAWRTARQSTEYRLVEWQKVGVYVVLFLVINSAVFGVTQYVRKHWVAAFSIPTKSMQPTLQQGDVLFADMRVGCVSCSKRVQRDDLVIFKTPHDPNILWVKRAVALGGDPIPGDESKQVPEGHMFVMGDNRDNSRDSRHIGTIELSSVVGKVRQIFWSYGDDGIRWDRLGLEPK